MNIFKYMFKKLGFATLQKSGVQNNEPSISAHTDSQAIGIDSALQVSTVWACVTLLTETISSMPLFVYKRTKGVSEKAIDLQIYDILHRSPNANQTPQEFWEQMLLNYFLRGNMYAHIKRNQVGECVALYPLAADQVEVKKLEDGSLLYMYGTDDKVLIFSSNDILHIKGMGNGSIGLSPLDYMRSSVGLAISAQNHTTKTFKKNARRPGILMSDIVLNPDQRKKLKENFSDIASGNGSELHILEANFKFEALGMSPADIQLLETRRFSVQDLARWFGVPSVLINDTAETTSLGSSVEQIVDGFHKLKLRPQLNRIEQVINNRLLTSGQRARGLFAQFNLDALLRSSLKDRMEVYSKGVQNGINTRNECRAKENLPPIEGGDMLTAQSNLLPLDKLGMQSNTGSVPEQPVRQ